MSRYLGCIALGAAAGILLLVITDFVVSQCFDTHLIEV
jgi:hypothetical protein